MFKRWSLRLSVIVKKAIVRGYPLALRGRKIVSWRFVLKASLVFLLYPALAFIFAVSGLEPVARFLVSPFAPTTKANLWFFFLVVSVPVILPLVSAFLYWLPGFMRLRIAVPVIKAALVALLVAPLVLTIYLFISVILSVIVGVLMVITGAGARPVVTERYDEWTDVRSLDHEFYAYDD